MSTDKGGKRKAVVSNKSSNGYATSQDVHQQKLTAKKAKYKNIKPPASLKEQTLSSARLTRASR